MKDTELLRIEINTLWDTDASGRLLDRARHRVVGLGRDGVVVAVGTHLPGALADELTETLTGHDEPDAATLAWCERTRADVVGPIDAASGPSYLVGPGIRFQPEAPVVVRSGGPLEADPPEGWTSRE